MSAVFALWQAGGAGEVALVPAGAEWVDHGALSVYAADGTLMVANAGF